MNLFSFFIASLALHGALIALPIRSSFDAEEEVRPVTLQLASDEIRTVIETEPIAHRPAIKPTRTTPASKILKPTRRERTPKFDNTKHPFNPTDSNQRPASQTTPRKDSDIRQADEAVPSPTAPAPPVETAIEPVPSAPKPTDGLLRILTAPLTAPTTSSSVSPASKATVPASDTGASSASEAPSKARYAYNPAPEYPERAKREGWEGTVLLQVRIDSYGTPDNVDINRSSGFVILDQAARESVKKWRFHPAHAGDRQIPSTVQIPIVFRLVDAKN
ncbi:MAG: energy transducer TonB [Candidatus Binatia bacterium]